METNEDKLVEIVQVLVTQVSHRLDALERYLKTKEGLFPYNGKAPEPSRSL